MTVNYIILLASFIRTVKGSILLLIDGYTYSKNTTIRQGGTRFACSSTISKNCKAYVHMSTGNVILKAMIVHNHAPPEFHITKDGRYLKKN